jgi:hypothetical protein
MNAGQASAAINALQKCSEKEANIAKLGQGLHLSLTA